MRKVRRNRATQFEETLILKGREQRCYSFSVLSIHITSITWWGGPQDPDSAEHMSLGTLQSHFIWKGELIGIF